MIEEQISKDGNKRNAEEVNKMQKRLINSFFTSSNLTINKILWVCSEVAVFVTNGLSGYSFFPNYY